MQVSIIIPSIRPDGAKRCVESIHAHAGVLQSQYEILVEQDVDRIGCPRMVAKLTERAAHDLVMFLGDDTEMEQDCLKNALAAMEGLPDGWGMAGLNDNYLNGAETASHFLISKKMLPLIGGEIFHTGYFHVFVDNELTCRAKELGRYVWAEDARILHHHPVLRGESPIGTDYEAGYRADRWWHDSRLFKRRQKNGWKT